MSRRHLLDVARRRRPADLVITGGTLVNVHTGELYPSGVAVADALIAAVGEVEDTVAAGTRRLDASGHFVVPGLIDAHIHTYESHLSVPHISTAMLLRGVTTIATDFYGEAVVGGIDAIRASLRAAEAVPLNVLWTLPMPAYYQDRPFVHTGTIGDAEVRELLGWEECIGVDECFAPMVVEGDPILLELMESARALGKALCGHASETTGARLAAWAAYGGYLDDHESVDPAEAAEKARLGIRVILREGSGAADVVNCLPAITEHGIDSRRFAFCSDLLSPVDLVRRGNIDRCVRLAIDAGVAPVNAVRMGSLNAAEALRHDRELGAVAPGKRADICLVPAPLERFKVAHVVANGQVVVEDGRYVGPLVPVDYPADARGTVRLPRAPEPAQFAVASPSAGTARVRAIAVQDGTIITEEELVDLPVRNGLIEADVEHDVLKVASIERHGLSGDVGLGFVRGFGLRRGALASTYNPHCQHLLVLGADDGDMAVAARAVQDFGGGFAVAAGGRFLAGVPLPLYGLLSERSAPELVGEIEAALDAVRALGCRLSAPFHTLAFLGLPVVIGKLKICSAGLVDVWGGKTVSLEVGPAEAAPSPSLSRTA